MAYTINLTDGTVFATIPDGTINTDSSMILVGKNYAGYGEFLDENFIHLLENGANNSAPSAPLTGQLWYDKGSGVLKVFTGTTFKVIGSATASSSQPTNNVVGDLWFDTTNQQLRVWNGTSFILVGPASTPGTGQSGQFIDTIVDNTGTVTHVVVKMFVNNSIVAIFSKDSSFTPQTPISGFTTINPGITMASTISGVTQKFQGTATNADALGGQAAANFLSSVANDTTSGTLGVRNDAGFSVGADDDFAVSVSGSNVRQYNVTQDGDMIFYVNDGGVTTEVMRLNGASSTVTIPTSLTVPSITGNVTATGNVAASGMVASGNVTAGNVSTGAAGAVSCFSITHLGANAAGNIGSSSSYFNRVFATSTSALYADLAERFAADAPYPSGTVVELGGAAEITRAQEELSDRVFGVISSKAAFLMNGGAGEDDTHPAVAMTGRVPVLVVGQVRKGDRLVSAGNGLARAAANNELTAFNVIGRSLEDKFTDSEGTVEAIVTIN